MKIKLSKGEACVRVRFPRAASLRRCTEMAMSINWNDGTKGSYAEVVACSPKDNFRRLIGRKLVCQKFLHDWGLYGDCWATTRRLVWDDGRWVQMRSTGSWIGHQNVGSARALTKDDRRLIWEAICPEFGNKKTKELEKVEV